MVKKYILISLFILLGFSVSHSQKLTITDEKFNEHKEAGDKYYQDEEYYLAAQEYLKASKLKPNDPHVDFLLAECYRRNFDYDDAEKWYGKVFGMHNEKYPLAQFWLGITQKTNGKYLEAEKTLDSFIKTFKPKTEDDKIRLKEADFEYKGCVFSIDQLKKPIKEINFKVLPPPVNSKNTDYAPMIFFHDSSVVITSARADSKGTEMNLATGEARSDNFRFEKVGDKWVRHHNEDNFDIVNTPYDDGAGELTKDKSKYYYSICDPECGIYVSKKVGGKFTKSVKLNKNINAVGYWNAQPTLSPTSDTMFFVSKRPGGKGMNDIWMCINKDKSGTTEEWGPAINMVKINTPYVEISPFWDDHTNTIYFASDGRIGFGGLDVYMLTTGSKTSKRDSVINMGLPFNSNRNDFYFNIGKERGYLVSDRRGGIGLGDIYMFDLKARESVVGEIPKDSFVDAESVTSSGRLIYNDTQEPVANISVQLKDQDGTTMKEAITNANGEFRFENLPPDKNFKIYMNENDPRISAKVDYEIHKKQVLASSLKTNSEPKTDIVQKQPDPVKDSAKAEIVKLNTASSIEKKTNTPTSQSSVSGIKSNIKVSKFQLKSSYKKPSSMAYFEHVYFDFNSIELLSPGTIILDDLINYYGAHKDIQIEIRAHTDGYGDDAYNKQLSVQRGQACFDYLVGRGVDQTALLIIPVATRKPLGSNNSFIGRQLNRRVEFTIIGATEVYKPEAMAYVVEPRMTLYSISKKFNMSVDELKSMNGYSGHELKAYSTIRVKRSENADIIAPYTISSMQEGKQEYKFENMQFVPSGNSLGTTEDPNISNISDEEGYYLVQPQETLYSIAKKNGLTVDKLKELNGLNSNEIAIGQKLKIK